MKTGFQIRATALALGTACALVLPASAQLIEVDPAPQTNSRAPHQEAISLDAAAIAPQERGRRVADGAGAPTSGMTTRLAPLRPTSRRVESLTAPRLTGEVTTERFVLMLPTDPGATDLRIAHRSSIDVLPQDSGLRVRVNGREVGALTPDNFSGFQDDSIALENGVLRAGRNEIEIEARHTHRVACGPDASFAVWTEISTAQSGVAMPAGAFGPDAAGFVSALGAQVAHGAAIPVRRADPQQSLGDAAPLLAELAAILGGTPPGIETLPYWTLAPETAPMARVTVVPREAGLMAPRVARSGDGALVLLVEEGAHWSDLRRVLETSFAAPDDDGLEALSPGSAVPLSSLAPERLTAEGRYDVLEVGFRLPPDWLMLTSAKARLDLDYDFAAGLPEGSLMLVKANGMTIQMLPLDERGEQSPPTLTITFPGRLLRSGANRLDFEVLVPGDPVDRSCPAMAEPVISVSPDSQLTIPATPRMSLASLDRALAALTLDRVEATGRAANTFDAGTVPQIAAALVPLGSARPGPGRAEASLTIATPADLEVIETGALRDIRAALTEALSRDRILDADRLAATATATAWASVNGAATGEDAPATGLPGIAGRVAAELRRLTLGAAQPADQWLDGRRPVAALLQPDLDRPGDIWLVLGPQADPAAIARILAATRDAADGPSGQLSVYTEEDGWQSWTSPDLRLDLHEPVTIRNLRDIMGTYATLEPLQFIGATLFLTALSILAALGFIVVTRGRT